MADDSTIRLFVAIFPPPVVVEQLAKAARSLAGGVSLIH
jgi:2'-5' RNA ligase